MKLATVFSGIGAIESALIKKRIKHEIIFACDNGEIYIDIDEKNVHRHLKNFDNIYEKKRYIDKIYNSSGKINYVQKSYMANYNIDESNFYQDVRFLDGNVYRGKIDLFVGGSPCQSFSISGNHLGLEDTRGTLFYEFARLVKEIQPKIFIYENVPGILSNDKGRTWSIITDIFEELGYDWYMDMLNSKDFGIPQNRKRVFVVGFRKDFKIKNFKFPLPIELKLRAESFLLESVPKKYYHGEKGFKWVTNPKNLSKRVSINSEIIRTQAANQQYNWCGDMRFEPLSEVVSIEKDDNIYISNYNGIKGVCRKLTPRECLNLMGFHKDFKIVVPDQKMYRQAGNSIVVNVLEHIIDSIINTGIIGDIND